MRVHNLSPALPVVALIALLLFGFSFIAGQQSAALASPNNPISTSTSTITPNGPTDTPIVTTTPGGPTDTPITTSTPGGPTDTPAASATPTDCANPFVDITGNIFYAAIHLLNCEGVINGTDATHYSPSGTATRGQFAKVIALGFNLPPVTPGGPGYFNCQGYYACVYLETLHAAGIFDGYSPQQCHDAGGSYPCALPNRPVTRAELTKMVVLAGHYPLYTPSGGPDFIDVPITNYWAYVYIETAYHYGLINGYPGHLFFPNNNIRRDEMAQIVYKGILNKP